MMYIVPSLVFLPQKVIKLKESIIQLSKQRQWVSGSENMPCILAYTNFTQTQNQGDWGKPPLVGFESEMMFWIFFFVAKLKLSLRFN